MSPAEAKQLAVPYYMWWERGDTCSDVLVFFNCASGIFLVNFLSPLPNTWLRPKVIVSSGSVYLNFSPSFPLNVLHSSSCLGRTSLKSCYQWFYSKLLWSKLAKLEYWYLKGTFRSSHFLFKQRLAFMIIVSLWS